MFKCLSCVEIYVPSLKEKKKMFFFSVNKNASFTDAKTCLDTTLDHLVFIGKCADNFDDCLGRKLSERARQRLYLRNAAANGFNDDESQDESEESGRESDAMEFDQENLAIENLSGERGEGVEEEEMEVDGESDSDYEEEDEGLNGWIRKKDVILIMVNDSDLLINADREKRSSDDLQREVAIMAKKLGGDITDVIGVSASTFTRRRHDARQDYVEKAEDEVAAQLASYPNQKLVAHWDGALMRNRTGGLHHSVDRVPVVLSGLPDTHTLTYGKLTSGTGEAQATLVVKTLRDWGIDSRVFGLSMDTTASNTGWKTGAAVLIEKMLGRLLFPIPCQHHIYERVVEGVFKLLFKTTGPTDAINDELRKLFEVVRHDRLQKFPSEWLQKVPAELLDEAVKLLQDLKAHEYRGDYKELIQLSLVALGALDGNQVMLQACQNTSHARFGGHELYSLRKVSLIRYFSRKRGSKSETVFK